MLLYFINPKYSFALPVKTQFSYCAFFYSQPIAYQPIKKSVLAVSHHIGRRLQRLVYWFTIGNLLPRPASVCTAFLVLYKD